MHSSVLTGNRVGAGAQLASGTRGIVHRAWSRSPRPPAALGLHQNRLRLCGSPASGRGTYHRLNVCRMGGPPTQPGMPSLGSAFLTFLTTWQMALWFIGLPRTYPTSISRSWNDRSRIPHMVSARFLASLLPSNTSHLTITEAGHIKSLDGPRASQPRPLRSA